MISNQQFFFNLQLTAAEVMPYYQGQASAIVVTTLTGQRVQFPAMHLRPFITSNGISGKFCLLTKNNKFFSLEKLSL